MYIQVHIFIQIQHDMNNADTFVEIVNIEHRQALEISLS